MKFEQLVKKEFHFPDGSYHCKLNNDHPLPTLIEFTVRGGLDIIKLSTQVNACRNMFGDSVLYYLNIPYIQSARQDRLCDVGEPFTSKVVAELINFLKFDRVITIEPHSDVMPALINNVKVIGMEEVFNWQQIIKKPKVFFVSPDGGAIKRTLRVSKKVSRLLDYTDKIEIGVIFAEKVRDPKTGEISSIEVKDKLDGKAQYIVIDDVCAMGGTFLGLNKSLVEQGANWIDIVLPHVDAVNGLERVAAVHDMVYITNSQGFSSFYCKNIDVTKV